MKRLSGWLTRAVVLLLASGVQAEPEPIETLAVVRAMRAELARVGELSGAGADAPYHTAYWVVDFERHYVEASLGAALVDETATGRKLHVELRLGDRTLDNSHYVPSTELGSFRAVGEGLEPAPGGDDVLALRRALWRATDDAFRDAKRALDAKRTESETEVDMRERAGDFTDETLESVRVEHPLTLPSHTTVTELAEALSRVFSGYPDVHSSSVVVEAFTIARTLVATGDVLSHEPSSTLRVGLFAASTADDGMPVERRRVHFGTLDAERLTQDARELARDVTELRRAPLVDDASGPVLFEGVAAAQIVRDLLGSSLSGAPGDENTESPLVRRIGKRVGPKGLRVFDDPTREQYRGLDLFGGYAMDDEGVRARAVTLIDDGHLRELLMSRAPRPAFPRSNGHGRSGLSGWARGAIGNLIFEMPGGLSRPALRARLMRAVESEGGDVGFVVKKLSERDFGTSGQFPPVPERVYRIHSDGREERVRGARIAAMALRDVKDILASGQSVSAHHALLAWPGGFPTPTSVVAPDLLFEDVELRRDRTPHALPPALSPPPRH